MEIKTLASLRKPVTAFVLACMAAVFAVAPAMAAETICATVKLQISQEAALEREGFIATLGINNNLSDISLTDLRVDLIITDAQGQSASHLFYSRVSNLENLLGVDGSGMVQPAAKAQAQWLMVPSVGAGGSALAGQQYTVQARMMFNVGGIARMITTYPALITVKPQPLLKLEYALPFEVFGNEPLTPDVTESTEPFYLGIRAVNIGTGTANNFSIATGQPVITESLQSLAVDFMITGAWLPNGQAADKSFKINFGDIPSGGAKQAAWLMTSSLSGRFTDFTATFTHSATLGGALTSLIDSVATYTLVKDVLADLPDRDTQFDFLVNKTTPRAQLETIVAAGEEVQPEYIMESDREGLSPVLNVPATLSGSLSGANSVLHLTYNSSVTPGTWAHASVPVTFGSLASVSSALRANGTQVSPRNVWISKHFDKNTRLYSYHVHLLDYVTETSPNYALTFSASALDTEPAPVANLSAAATPSGMLALSWTSVGEDGTSGTIYNGKYALFYSTDAAATPSLNSASVLFSTTTRPAQEQAFVLNNLLGNATYQFALWTADAQMHYSTMSNVASALAPAYIPGTPYATEVNESSFTVVWNTTANTAGTEYNVRVSSAQASGLIAESGYVSGLAQRTFDQLSPNGLYYAAVQARDTLSRETAFSTATAVYTLARKPEAGAAPVVSVSSGGAHLAWLAAGNPADTSYAVRYALAPDFSGWNGSVQTSTAGAVLSGLSPNTTYYFKAAAVNRNNVPTEYLALGSTVTLSAQPLISAVSASSDTLNIAWSTVSASGYLVELATNGFAGGDVTASASILDGGQSSYGFTGLAANSVYSAKVSALNSAGNPTASPLAAAYTLALEPSGLAVTAISSDTVSLAWGATPGEGYIVEASSSPAFTALASSASVPAGAVNTQLAGLSPNSRYYYRVGNANHNGVYSYTGAISSATLAATPGLPEFAEVNSSSVTVRWSANGNPAGTAYHAELSSAQDFSVLSASADVSALSSVFSGLAYESTYYFRVAARNMDGVLSAYEASASTVTRPDLGTQPVISEISPSSGPIGIPFTLAGLHFGTYNGAYTKVLFGGTTSYVSLWTDTKIQGTVPGLAAMGNVSVVVERVLPGVGVHRSEVGTFTLVAPAATEITPSSGPIGVPYTLTGSGFGNYNGAMTRVLIGGATTPVTLWNDGKIQGTIPGTIQPGQQEVIVERATADGGLSRSATIYFTLANIVPASITPSSGSIGVPFTITGSGFGNYLGATTQVLIGGTTAPVTLWTDTKIQGTVPGAISAGEQPVVVIRKTSDGGLETSATIYFTVTLPGVESITPSTAPIGVPFTITGTSFGPYNGSSTRVLIGGTTASVTAWNDTTIQGTIPGTVSDGEKAVIVERATADGGLMRSVEFAFNLVPPVATEIIPSTGPIGIPYTLLGYNFGNYIGANTNVLVNGATTQINSWTDTKIQGTIPGAEPGSQAVVVERKTADGGLRHSAPIYFTVSAMAMDSVAPSSGPIGIPFTVSGNNFGNYNGNNTRLMLGVSTVTVSAWSNTVIQGVVPGIVSGEYPLAIERVASDGTLMRSATMPFIITTPAIASMAPANGPIGIAYTLNGSSFGQYNGTNTQVLIGGTTTPITLWNDSVIQGTVPGVSGGPQPVMVRRKTADGGLVESSSFTYIVQGLTISSVLPSSGPIGVPFTITGSDFGAYNGSNTRVKFGDILAPITLWNNTTIQGTIPGVASGLRELSVERVSSDGGLMPTTTAYLVTTPEITGMSPAAGPIGIAYTLTGASFGPYNGANTQVLIGGTTTAISLWNDNKIQGTIPGTIATGAQPVIVRRKTADGGMVESSSATYTVSGIEISSVTPPSGPIGIAFTINGANFGTYNGTNTKVKFCGLVAPITSWTDVQIKGTIPGASAGDCELAIERITADGGLMRGTTVFAIAGPVVTSMSTSTAPIGLPITLNGANFGTYNGSYTRVKINGVVMPVSVWNDTKIQGTVPGIAQPGEYPLVVERATADGGLSQSTATTFGVVAPQLTTMSPTSLRIGTVAYTLNGTGFGNYNGANTVVLIGGTTTAVSVWTDTQIKGTTPGSLQTGTHQVIVRRIAQGVASDSNALILELVLPVISAIDPTTGVAGTGFTITGTGFGPYDSTVVGGYPSTRVKVGTMVASLSEWTDTQIRGIIPDTLGPGIHSVTVQRVTSAGSAVSNTVTFAIDGGSGSSGRSARGLSNFMPVRGKATVSSYPTKLVEAGLPLLKEHGGRPESWNRTSVTIAPDTLPEDMFISIALNKGEESSLEELEAALVPSKVAAAGPSTVFGPLGTNVKAAMTIELPYSAQAIPDGKSELDLAIHKWNKAAGLWESIPSELDTRNKRLRATVNGFGTYQAMARGVLYADATFKLGEIYSFPNPAKGGHKPTLHIEVGVADYVKVRIYDVAGDLRHSVQIDAAPVILDDGTGAAYAYEYAWNTSGVGSGVYIYVIEAHKGDETIRATRKLTYIR